MAKTETGLTRKQVIGALAILLVLVFSKCFYLAGLNSYLTFYLIHRFGVSIQNAQYCLFVFLFAAALGALADATSIEFVYHVCAFLPLLGVAAFLLPNQAREAKSAKP